MGYTCNFDNAPPKLREAFHSLVGMRWRYWNDLLFSYALCKGSDCGDAKDAKEKAANDEADHDPD